MGLEASGAAELQFQRARLLVGALARAGVRRAVTSPGSRSTPLVLAALDAAASERLGGLEVESVIDERAAAFFALGQARVTGMPTVLICTSGSAAAHYFPAILEAREAGLPLIVLSADRPFELMDCASPQTTDQTKLFGSAVSFFAEIDLGGRTDALSLRALRRTAAQAVFRSRWPRGGAVHLNVRARKPLERSEVGETHPLAVAVDRLLEAPLEVGIPGAVPDPDTLDRAVQLCLGAERGLIVAGAMALPPPGIRLAAAGAGARPGCSPEDSPDARPGDRPSTGRGVFGLRELARRTGFPLAAEATSQSRFVERDRRDGGECPGGYLADCLGAAWAADGGKGLAFPDLVLQVGAPPVSAGTRRLLEASGASQIVLSDGSWTDPAGLAAVFLPGDVGTTVAGLCFRLQEAPADSAAIGWRTGVLAFCRRFGEAAARVGSEARTGQAGAGVSASGKAEDGLHDGKVARAVVEATPSGGLLMLGNSLPVRLVEDWVERFERRVWVASQRGLSGIEGLVAGFLGSLSASAGEFPAGVLLLGDVSLLHDLDSLTLASTYGDGPPAVVVVIDNGGGRIFERLPIASTQVFRSPQGRHWLTPHGVDLGGLAEPFQLRDVHVVGSAAALERELRAAVGRRGLTLVVARCVPGALEAAEDALRRTMSSGAVQGDDDHAGMNEPFRDDDCAGMNETCRDRRKRVAMTTVPR